MGDLVSVLDIDCLQEILLRCGVKDLVSLMQTCRRMNLIIRGSPLVWKAKLWEDFGWESVTDQIVMSPSIDSRMCHYQSIYKLYRSKTVSNSVRFRGLYTNGGMDGGNESYWVDNAFKGDHSPYCSNISSNVDIVGVLLNDYREQMKIEAEIRNFMRERCRLAAEWIVHLNQTRNQSFVLQADSFSINQLSDLQLKQFFLSLVESYNQGSSMGHFLLIDVEDDLEEQERRVWDMVSVLQQQDNCRRNSIANVGPDVYFDKEIVNSIQIGRLDCCAIHSIEIGRMGHLTCPVSCGVIFGCRIDNRNAMLLGSDILNRLSQSMENLCAFEHLDSIDILMEKSRVGDVPRVAKVTIMHSPSAMGGCFVEFRRRKRARSCSCDFEWLPIGWFSFDQRVSQRLRAGNPDDFLIEDSALRDELGTDEGPTMKNIITGSLTQPMAVNFLSIKLISQENLMEQMFDEHDHPNIDLSLIKINGKVLGGQ